MSNVGILCWNKLVEIANNISADNRKHLNDTLIFNDGTCKQEIVLLLEGHLRLNKGSSDSVRLSGLMALAKKVQYLRNMLHIHSYIAIHHHKG